MSDNITIKDVALAANVSIATVSRVINQNSSVNSELKKRVIDVIEELNYYPNSVARSLKTENTSTVAFLVSNISDPFFITIGRGIEDKIKDYHYNLMVCSTDNSKDKEQSYLKILQEKKVDGIILNTTGKNNAFIAKLSQKIPIVLSNRRINDSIFLGDFVDNDNIGGAYQLTNHLLSLGHKKIGIINGPLYLSTGNERYKGFCNAMALAGHPIPENYPYYYGGNFTFQDGYDGADMLMRQNPPPTAILMMNSELALGALKYFVTHQIKIPEDVSIASFGDIQNRELLYVQPTIASTNLYGIGNKMGELIIERIQSKNQMKNREIQFVTQLSLGNSTRSISDTAK